METIVVFSWIYSVFQISNVVTTVFSCLDVRQREHSKIVYSALSLCVYNLVLFSSVKLRISTILVVPFFSSNLEALLFQHFSASLKEPHDLKSRKVYGNYLRDSGIIVSILFLVFCSRPRKLFFCYTAIFLISCLITTDKISSASSALYALISDVMASGSVVCLKKPLWLFSKVNFSFRDNPPWTF